MFFSSESDLNQHVKVCVSKNGDWKKSQYDDSEWDYADENKVLAQAVRNNGRFVMGEFQYSLSKNGKYLKREAVKVL
jgi:hypothetical protein